jgi:hypothetical protein
MNADYFIKPVKITFWNIIQNKTVHHNNWANKQCYAYLFIKSVMITDYSSNVCISSKAVNNTGIVTNNA